MRVLYVAPRYHTNQIPVVSGWLEQGDRILFLSQFVGTPEDYTVMHPVVIGYSKLFEVIAICYRKLFCRKEKSGKKEFDLRIKIGFPPLGTAKRYIDEFEPDVVILRERSVYNISFYQQCKKRNIPCILYNQSPLWDDEKRDKKLLKRIFLPLLPHIRMTPVMGRPDSNKIRMPDTVFVPFVMEPHISPEKKTYFKNDKIHILCVGRYEERKKLFMLLEVLADLQSEYPIELTVIGEYKNDGQKEYYSKLEKQIKCYNMEDKVHLLKNLDMEQMYREYGRADLFVLPSTKERASVSQLEAMSCSLPVICSDTNGSACYVENGKSGYLFRDCDKEDLKQKITMLLENRDTIVQMGEYGYRLVCESYGFARYRENICNIINKI